MSNHLSKEISPYLLQHAENPVDWYPWGSEALNRARVEGKPIFLSIGYAACHWCHVMAHESFEDPEIADFLNLNFINIKVDREERPDIDSIYMAAVVAMTRSGGWPMSVFLTPDLKPFYGGTYFPPEPRYGMPAFKEVIRAVQAAWNNERDQVVHSASHILETIQNNALSREDHQQKLEPKVLTEAIAELLSTYDWAYGGWGRAPKFPQPMLIEVLLQQGIMGNQEAMQAALHALDAMSRGGMFDIVGGGFHRYSTDTGWLVPHFEKMLYDNAQLAGCYLHAYLQSGREQYRQTCQSTLDYMLREMRHPLGGFFASLDADSPDGEGYYYAFSLEEIHHAADTQVKQQIIDATFDLPAQGNFNNRILLTKKKSSERIALDLGLPLAEYSQNLNQILLQLAGVRKSKARPATDEKILTSWNGFSITALAEAGRYLERADYLEAAQNCANFLLENLWDGEHLFRAWRDTRSQIPGFLEDYAALILGLLALYQADGNLKWYKVAINLADKMVTNFSDPEGGFFDTDQSMVDIPFRPKDAQDNATPSGGALAVRALLSCSAFLGSDHYTRIAERSLVIVQEGLSQYPSAFGGWLAALDLAVNPPLQIAIVWDKTHTENQINSLVDVGLKTYRPATYLARACLPLAEGSPALLLDRPLIHNLPTAYVCQSFICRLPVTDQDEFKHQLG